MEGIFQNSSPNQKNTEHVHGIIACIIICTCE